METDEERLARQAENKRVTKHLHHKKKMQDPEYKKYFNDLNWARNLMVKFGITAAEYHSMLEAQNGVCAICLGVNKNGKRLSVDHNHETGKVRGLLCQRCNLCIGQFEEDQGTLLRAVDYLLKYNQTD